MLKKSRNKFVTEVNKLGVNLTDYDVDYRKESTTESGFSELFFCHKKTKFIFNLRADHKNWDNFDCEFSEFSPGFPIEEFPKGQWATLDECLEKFKFWKNNDLHSAIDEINTPDYLDILREQDNLVPIDSFDFSQNTKFNNEELKSVQLGMEEIRILISKEFQFSRDEMKFIENRLQYIESSAERLGRIDWKNILIASIPSIIIALCLDTETGEKLWQLFSKIIFNIKLIEF